MSERKEKRRKEARKPREVNLHLWALWRPTAFHSSIGRRLWRCLDSFDCTSRVTFECLHFDECSAMEISGKESIVVEKIFFVMIIANLFVDCEVICECRSFHPKGSC